jgi:hypothetical protein
MARLRASHQDGCRDAHRQAPTPPNPVAAEDHSLSAIPRSPTHHRPVSPLAYQGRVPSPLSHHGTAPHPARAHWSTLATSPPVNPLYLNRSNPQNLSYQQTPQG